MEKSVAWSKTNTNPFGLEFCQVSISSDGLKANGVSISPEPVPYRLDYELETDTNFVTRELIVRCHSQDWRHDLHLTRSADGIWKARSLNDPSKSLFASEIDSVLLDRALDCDLGLSPLTNTMPVLRNRVFDGAGPIDLIMVWVSVPDLSLHLSKQRYSFISKEGNNCKVRYESENFATDITLDSDGIVLNYPQLAKRL